MDGIVVSQITKERPIVDLPEGADQLLIIPLIGEVTIRVEPTEGLTSTRLSEQATLLRQSGEGSNLKLEGEGALLILYRLKQQKTVENVNKAKRAGLYPYCPKAMQQSKAGVPSATRSGPMGIGDIERWRIRAGQEEDPDLAPYLCALEKGEHTLRRKYERSLGGASLAGPY